MSGWDRLNAAQQAWAYARLDEPELVQDMSWNLMESIVLHVSDAEGEFVVKAGDADNHHIDRELSAHPEFTHTLVESGRAARLRDGDPSLRMMILDYLPGQLVEGTDAERLPDSYAQAGSLLRELHRQDSREDAQYWPRAIARAHSWLDRPHRVAPEAADQARRILNAAPTKPATVVPTHGDWQPRNWLLDGETVRVIDFGRFAFRPAATDLTRLAAQQWRERPDLEAAFFEGYGQDPRHPDEWRLERLQEAVGTACWAFHVGDEAFENQGHRMLNEVLAAF